MIFRRPKSYSITLQRAHSLLRIPRTSAKPVGGREAASARGDGVPSRDRIQEAFRSAAKRHHPDLMMAKRDCRIGSSSVVVGDGGSGPMSDRDGTRIFRECHDARELLLDHYVRGKFVHPEILESTRDHPVEWKDESFVDSFASMWRTEGRSFRTEAILRLSACLTLAVATYYHDKYMPERRERQIRRRDAQFGQFGPSPPRF